MFFFKIGDRVSYYDEYYKCTQYGKVLEIFLNMDVESPYFIVKLEKDGIIARVSSLNLRKA